MAKLFIIENDLNDWREVRNLLHGARHEVFPNDEQTFNKMRAALSQIYSEGNTTRVISRGRDTLNTLLAEQAIDLYIVDFELKKDKAETANGVVFCDEFIPDQRVLFLTGMTDANVINDINNYCGGGPFVGRRSHLLKARSNKNQFRTIFLKRVEDMAPSAEAAGDDTTFSTNDL